MNPDVENSDRNGPDRPEIDRSDRDSLRGNGSVGLRANRPRDRCPLGQAGSITSFATRSGDRQRELRHARAETRARHDGRHRWVARGHHGGWTQTCGPPRVAIGCGRKDGQRRRRTLGYADTIGPCLGRSIRSPLGRCQPLSRRHVSCWSEARRKEHGG